MSVAEDLLSFFGEECWPYAIGNPVITSVEFTPAVGLRVNSRIIVHLKCGKSLSIIKFFRVNETVTVWETAEISGGVPKEIKRHFTLSGLFDYLSS